MRFGRWARVLVASAGGDAAAVVATGEADGATTGESCLRVLVARSAGGDAAAVMATGEADGATTGESCLRRGEWYAASPP